MGRPYPLRRSHDAAEINAILNHPEVYPWVACRIPRGEVDVSGLLADPRNVLLMLRGGGFFCVAQTPPGLPAMIYEVHIQFLPNYRGLQVYHGAKHGVAWMFDNTEAQQLVAYIPTKLRTSQHVAHYAGFRRTGKVLKGTAPSPFGLMDAYEYVVRRAGDVGAARGN